MMYFAIVMFFAAVVFNRVAANALIDKHMVGGHIAHNMALDKFTFDDLRDIEINDKVEYSSTVLYMLLSGAGVHYINSASILDLDKTYLILLVTLGYVISTGTSKRKTTNLENIYECIISKMFTIDDPEMENAWEKQEKRYLLFTAEFKKWTKCRDIRLMIRSLAKVIPIFWFLYLVSERLEANGGLFGLEGNVAMYTIFPFTIILLTFEYCNIKFDSMNLKSIVSTAGLRFVIKKMKLKPGKSSIIRNS